MNILPKWVMDLIMNLLWDVQNGTQLPSAAHLNVVPPGYRDIATGILAYHGQLDAARGAVATAVAQAPAQDSAGAASPDIVPPLPDELPNHTPPESQPVTQVMPLADSPQASVPANSAGR